MTTLCYLFPGQGGLAAGMGAGIFDQFPQEVAIADEVLGYSIRTLCEKDPENRLNDTRFTQPAMYTVSALTYLKTVRETQREPDFVAGHSLGEYTALFAAGAFDFVTGLRLVQERGALMAQSQDGGMAAVMSIPRERVQEVLAQAGFDAVDIANLNAPQQTVISGLKRDVEAAAISLEQAGAWVVPLKVSAAFHSRYMQPARKAFEAFVANFTFAPLQRPVIANVDARPHEQRRIRENLCRQITHPVRWVETIEFLLEQPQPQFQEIGPGNVLTGLVRQISKERAA